MPRETIELPYQVECLSILDEDGELDSNLEPDLEADQLLDFHRLMLLARRFDERMLNLQRQGRIGTFALVQGQEAAQIGSSAVLKESDWMIPSYRDTAAALWRNRENLVEFMVNLLLINGGFFQGGRLPEDTHNLPIAIPVGSQTLHAVGIGYGIKLKKRDDIAITYFGDGATSEGDFNEALNYAGVWQTPTIFICQNNQYAISLPREEQTKAKTLAQKGLAYGVPGIQVDGNDILAVYAAVHEAAERARAGDGPTLVECITYRLSLHTTADDPTRYRDEEEVEKWEKREPIARFRTYLKEKELLDDDKIEALEAEIEEQIQSAVDQAEEKMNELEGDTLSMFNHIYAQMPPYLQEQKESLADTLTAVQEATHD